MAGTGDPLHGELDTLLALYKPNVRGGPNFGPANTNRGANAMLAKCILALNLATHDEVEAAFRRLDAVDQARSDKAVAHANAQRRQERRNG